MVHRERPGPALCFAFVFASSAGTRRPNSSGNLTAWRSAPVAVGSAASSQDPAPSLLVSYYGGAMDGYQAPFDVAAACTVISPLEPVLKNHPVKVSAVRSIGDGSRGVLAQAWPIPEGLAPSATALPPTPSSLVRSFSCTGGFARYVESHGSNVFAARRKHSDMRFWHFAETAQPPMVRHPPTPFGVFPARLL